MVARQFEVLRNHKVRVVFRNVAEYLGDSGVLICLHLIGRVDVHIILGQ